MAEEPKKTPDEDFDHESNEAAWIAHGRKYAASFAAAEEEFFKQLEEQAALSPTPQARKETET